MKAGILRKGGINNEPTEPRPTKAPKGQGEYIPIGLQKRFLYEIGLLFDSRGGLKP